MSATPLPSDDLGGRLLGGRYRIKTLRGRGGMGAVWVAHDEVNDVDVAIKVVRAALLEDPQAMGRFKREAKVIRGLDHPGIVRSIDDGEDEGMLWIAMELLDGETLRQRLDGRGRMTWDESLSAAKAILGALRAAHAAGVIHRDLKPDNVMLAQDGRIKLLDFGVAKQSHLESASMVSSMTGTGFIVGTPGYVAPEVVLEGKNDDPRSDLYAFGVVWFEMLTGQKPFTAKTPFALAMRHAHEPAPRASTLLPFSPIPLAVENLVSALMAKSPDERPPSADAVLDLIEAIERGAAQAASGTPSPGTLDATETDIRDTPDGTAVVPMKLTPSVPGPLELAKQGTPPTGMVASPPPAASPLPGLLKALPRRHRVALTATTLLAMFGLISAVVFVVNAARDGGDDVIVPTSIAHRPEGMKETLPDKEQQASVSAGPKPDEALALVAEKSEEKEVTQGKEVEEVEEVEKVEKVEKVNEQVDQERQAKHVDVKARARPRSKESADEPAPSIASVRSSSATMLTRVKTVPKASTISVDGRPAIDSPLDLQLTAGEHVLKFDNGSTFTIHVRPGECRGYRILLQESQAVLQQEPTKLPCP